MAAAAVHSCATSRLFASHLPLAQQRAQPSVSGSPLPQGAFHGRERCSADSAAPCSSRRPEKLRGDFLGGRPVCLAEARQAPRQRSGVVCSGEPVGTSAVAELPGSRIWMSDVVARPKRNYFLDRQWTSKDLIYAGFMLFMHGACLLAPFTFSWDALAVFAGLYFITGCLGITLSFHRNLSHKSFKLPKPLEYLFAYCGIQAVQGDPIEWVSSHRYHHIHCDTENDPHTPKEGFWHSHMGWLLDDQATQDRVGKRTNVSDMENDKFYKFIQKTYPLHPIAAAVALFAWGGLPYLVWGMAVRVVWVYHITWFVNSASHVWGTQSWNTGDLSRNNWWVALLAFGEGWHNNHHAFEYSARHGLQWWQFDPTWYIILAMEKLGLATKVKLPRADHMARLSPVQPAV